MYYDVIGSQSFAQINGYARLYGCLKKFHALINRIFKNSIVEKEISPGRKLEKFRTIVGDSGDAYFSDSEVIIPITKLAKTLPSLLR